jgi:integrase
VLTDLAIKRIKPSPSPIKVSDSGGLHLLVAPTGSRLWKLAYRFARKQKTLSFGAYPEVSLADARARRETAKAQLRQGIDPGKAVKAEKQAAVAALANTFDAAGTEWVERKLVKQGRSNSTVKRAQWLLSILNAAIGDKLLTEIEPPEILDVLRRIEAQSKHETAVRMRAIASSVFRFGIATGACKRDPAADLRGALTSAVSEPRPAIVKPTEIGQLMRAIDEFPRPLMRLALKLLSLTAVRPGELLSAEWSEIENGVWSIPADKTKMRTAHRVPLSRQALAVLDELRAITGSKKHLLASPRKRGQAIAPNRFNYALREMGFRQNEMVAHGFRAMFSTLANESGQSSDVIELCLAHRERNKVRRAYNRAERWPERVDMMKWWADHLDELRNRGKVVALPTKKPVHKVGA